MPLEGGRTQHYCDWWRDQLQHDRNLFNAQLIGDAEDPKSVTPMAYNDLAYCRHVCCLVLPSLAQVCSTLKSWACCSKWGHNRVLEHKNNGSPLELILPVLTSPDILEQAVAGVLSGQISLSLSSVEPLLVLANAIGVSQQLAIHA